MSQATGIRLHRGLSPELRSGDHFDQKTFHERYEAAPEGLKAELVEGVVIVQAAASTQHAGHHSILTAWLAVYQAATPGTRTLSDATTILGSEDEVQPDAALIIEADLGGQTRSEGVYLAGPPELVGEVAFTSAAYDLHSKLRVYERAGVREYVVFVLREPRIEWFALKEGRFQPQDPSSDGVFRSAVFPGLWLDQAAALRGDVAQVLETLRRGLADPEHAAFLKRLTASE